MRFGIFIPQGWRHDLVGIPGEHQWAAMNKVAQRADTALAGDGKPAWESCWVFDHFHPVPAPTTEAVNEAWALEAAIAAVTKRVRIGQMCTCMAYRPPAYMAKVAATVDIISGGRLDFGIGAGWYEHEWLAYGYGFPRAGVRLGMLDEGVQIITRMWRDGNSGKFDGEYYHVDGAMCYPQPLQHVPGISKPTIPLWIAGGGEKVTLKLVAKYAQYANIAPNPDDFKHKSDILAAHCAEVGTDFSAITRSANYNVVIGTPSEREARLAELEKVFRKYTPANADNEMNGWRNAYLTGTAPEIVEKLHHMQSLGMTYAITYFPVITQDTDQVNEFEQEVIPHLR